MASKYSKRWIGCAALPALPYDPGEQGDPMHAEAPAEGRKLLLRFSHQLHVLLADYTCQWTKDIALLLACKAKRYILGENALKTIY
jgi:hypothetical protein